MKSALIRVDLNGGVYHRAIVRTVVVLFNG